MKFNISKGDSAKTAPADGIISTKFKRYVHRKGENKGNLNTLTPGQKVVAALTKALAIQGKRDGMNYYVNGDSIYCPSITVTGDDGKMSVKAKGRFLIGKVGENLTRGVMSFDIKFRDSKDERGLQDLTIESAVIDELPKGTPLC